jgi:hypothetical protein
MPNLKRLPAVWKSYRADGLEVIVYDFNRAVKVWKQTSGMLLRALKQRHQYPETRGERKRRKIREARRRAFRMAKRKAAEAQQARQRRNGKRR